MANPWFCKIDGQEVGPLSGSSLRAMVAQKKLLPDTPIRRGDSDRWVKASQVQGLFPASGESAQAALASSGQSKLKRAKSLDTPPQPSAPPPVASPPPVADAAPTQAKPPVPAAASPPQDSPAIPTGVPVGAPVESGQLPVGQAVAPAAPAHAEGYEDPFETRRRKKKQQQTITLVAIGVGVLVLAGGGLAYALMSGGSAPAVAQNSTNAENETPTPLAKGEPVANAEATEAESTPASAAAAEQAVAEMLSAVEHDDWRDVSPLRTISLPGKYKLKVTRVWLSDDPRGANALNPRLVLRSGSGTSAAASASEANAKARPAEKKPTANDDLGAILAAKGESLPEVQQSDDSTSAADARPGRYLMVALEVSNSSEEPLTYASWNPLGGEALAASLIANEQTELRALAIKQAAGPGRAGQQTLQPGASLTDHLVFAAPDQPVASLKLLLPKEAVGWKGMYGFLITPEVMAAEYEHRLAEPKKKTPPAAVAGGKPMPAAAAAGPNAAVAETPPPKEPQPLTKAEKLRRERDAFLQSINDEPEEKQMEEKPPK